ncbi:hypothetical protein Golob_004387 [Gossypium lobatum]|uniref:Uncharacterized protein n=1 Tax=Gossypium lobatum TaxID=34289 RepID=A0A7J8N1B7_9ROSI|nr:hypothetical protein [Gossypium lobatum]
MYSLCLPRNLSRPSIPNFCMSQSCTCFFKEGPEFLI